MRSAARLFCGAVLMIGCWSAGLPAVGGGIAEAQPLDLILPTDNDALLRGSGPDFYQYTDRYFNGQRLRPWQGGKYGFFRNPKKTPNGLIYTRFHEGVDIQPVYRDRNGEPLDVVRAVDEGYVVYVNDVPNHSSYGNYVVVEHWWSGAPFYSLYAHLGDVYAEAGQAVAQGDRLGRIGYTGVGINRRRAHLHFEIGMLLNRGFGQWYDEHYRPGTNRHGVFNGFNLRGLNVAALYKALEHDAGLTIGRFITQQQEPYYKIALPQEQSLDLLSRYPWLLRSGAAAEYAGWELAFTRGGLPIGIWPLHEAPEAATVTLSPELGRCGDLTENVLRGLAPQCTLSDRGERYLQLLFTGYPVEHAGPAW